MASSVLKQPQVKTMTKSYPAEYTIAGAGYYSIDNGADLLGKTIIGIVVTTWTSNTGAFSLIMGGGNAVYLVGTPNVKVKGLTVRYAYIQPSLAEYGMTSNIRNLPSIVEMGDGYKKWSDGTLEQWGRVSMPAQANTISVAVSFAKPFANPSYSFLLTAGRNVAASHMFSEANSAGNSARTVNGTAIVWSKSAHAYATEVSWYAIGKWT